MSRDTCQFADARGLVSLARLDRTIDPGEAVQNLARARGAVGSARAVLDPLGLILSARETEAARIGTPIPKIGPGRPAGVGRCPADPKKAREWSRARDERQARNEKAWHDSRLSEALTIVTSLISASTSSPNGGIYLALARRKFDAAVAELATIENELLDLEAEMAGAS